MEEKRSRKSVILKTAGRYLAEVAIIFIGITISFMFDEWRESERTKEEQTRFVTSLAEDLTKKRDEIKHDAQYFKWFFDTTDSVLGSLNRKEEPTQSSIVSLHDWYFYSRWYFQMKTQAYSNFYSTGQRQSLNDSLRKSIFKVFETDFQALDVDYTDISRSTDEELNYLYQQKVIPSKIQPDRIVASKFSHDEYVLLSNAVFRKEFIQRLQHDNMHYKRTIGHCDQTISDIDGLLLSLDAYLKRL
jgi:hypothetical protein